jgi:hypothetical protein
MIHEENAASKAIGRAIHAKSTMKRDIPTTAAVKQPALFCFISSP